MKKGLICAIILLTTLIVAPGQDTADKERVYSVPDINGRATLLVQPEIPDNVSIKADGEMLIVKVVVDGGQRRLGEVLAGLPHGSGRSSGDGGNGVEIPPARHWRASRKI